MHAHVTRYVPGNLKPTNCKYTQVSLLKYSLHSNKNTLINTCNTKSSVQFCLFTFSVLVRLFFSVFCVFCSFFLSYSTKHRQRHDKTMTTGCLGLISFINVLFLRMFVFLSVCVDVFVFVVCLRVVKRNDGLNHHNWLHCMCF